MSRVETTTNFRDSNGVDLGKKLITKDYLISVYPSIGQQIGIPPELWTWGYGKILGNAVTTGNISTPVTTSAGGTNWKQVSCGRLHTAAIKTDGTLWTWGAGFGYISLSGALGNAAGDVSTPVTTFAGGTNWKQVSCGYRCTAAIKTDGTLWTWGYAGAGRLGNSISSATSVSTPVTTFAGGTNWKQVSAGGRHMAAIKTDGTLWTWGRGDDGQLGNNSGTNAVSTPVTTFAGGTNWKQVSAGGSDAASGFASHTAAIKTDGTLWTWGNGRQGRLGNAVTTGSISTPVTTFAGGTNWKQVSATVASGRYTAAIKTDGTLWTWGYGYGGRLGNNSGTNVSTPVTTFAGGTNWKQVSGGDAHCAAIKTDGTLWTWGGGGSGQLGNATITNTLTPVTTSTGGTNWKQVSCGSVHTAAIDSVDF